MTTAIKLMKQVNGLFLFILAIIAISNIGKGMMAATLALSGWLIHP